jgi:predicted ATPase
LRWGWVKYCHIAKAAGGSIVITWLNVQSFKNLLNVQADFGGVNAVIGPNGCGKSSLLQAIDFLRAFFYPSIEDYLNELGWHYADLPNLRRAGKTIRWHLKAELGTDASDRSAGNYEYVITTRRWRYLGVGEEKLTYTPPDGEAKVLIDRKGRSLRRVGDFTPTGDLTLERMPRSLLVDITPAVERQFPEMVHFRNWIMGLRYFLMWDPKVLRRPDRGEHVALGASGEHLAPILANLKKKRPQQFAKIVSRVKRLFPTVTDIRIRGGGGWGWRQISLVEGDGLNVSFNSQQMSDGVLRLLAICTLLYADKIPGVLMFEEPENGIHPQLIREVIQVLRELTLRKAPNECQVFFTTHSPYVLDQFYEHPDEVYVMERGMPQEGATLYRLSDRSDIDLTRQLFSRSLGEAWFSGVIGGTATGS